MAKKAKAAKNAKAAKTAKTAKKTRAGRQPWSNEDLKLLKKHSRERTPVSELTKVFKRSEGSLRQKALSLGIGLGHRR